MKKISKTITQKARNSRFSSYQRTTHNILAIPDEGFYSCSEIAEQLHIHTSTVYRYIRSGKLKAKKVDNQFRVTIDTLKNFIKNSSS